jgi:plasmid stability protein
MTIELPTELESALRAHARAQGLSVEVFVRQVVERQLGSLTQNADHAPFNTGRGMFSSYGHSPSADEIDANRAEIFGKFGESLQ